MGTSYLFSQKIWNWDRCPRSLPLLCVCFQASSTGCFPVLSYMPYWCVSASSIRQSTPQVRDFPDGSLRWQVIASSLPISHTAESPSHTDPPSTNLVIALPAVCGFSYFGHHDDMHSLLLDRTLFRLMGKWLVAGELFLLIPWLNGCQYGLKSC